MAFIATTLLTTTQTLSLGNDTGLVTSTGVLNVTATAVVLSGGQARLINAGIINSADRAVSITGTECLFVNDGLVYGASSLGAVGISGSAAGVRIINRGVIQGIAPGSQGVLFQGAGELVNFGEISSNADTGVQFNLASRLENHGTISSIGGITTAVLMSPESDTLVNSGVITGTVALGDGRDFYRGVGQVLGVLNAGAGNDDIDLRGGTVTGSVFGDTGDDRFILDSDGHVLLELASHGNDTVEAWVDHDLADNFETLILVGPAVRGGGNAGANSITGNRLGNLIDADDGNDTVEGFNGADTVEGDLGDDVINGGRGNDVLFGGSGLDTISGNEGHDILMGDDGADRLVGVAGDDTLTGGLGADVLFGGQGADSFVYASAADTGITAASRDRIEGFASGIDEIDLSAIDANVNNAPDSAFNVVGALNGTAGQLVLRVAGGDGFLEGDTNGDGVADFSIQLTAVTAILATDLIL